MTMTMPSPAATPMPWASGWSAKSRSACWRSDARIASRSSSSCCSTGGRRSSGSDVEQIDEGGDQPARDLRRSGAGQTDLVEGEVDVTAPVHRGDGDPDPSARVVEPTVGDRPDPRAGAARRAAGRCTAPQWWDRGTATRTTTAPPCRRASGTRRRDPRRGSVPTPSPARPRRRGDPALHFRHRSGRTGHRRGRTRRARARRGEHSLRRWPVRPGGHDRRRSARQIRVPR